MIIDFISTSIFWLTLWALREYTQRRRFESINEEIEMWRASDRRQREENAALRNREQIHLQKIAGIEALFQKAQREGIFDLGGNGKLPAPAERDGQRSSLQRALQQDYVRLTGPLNGGSGFFRREQ